MPPILSQHRAKPQNQTLLRAALLDSLADAWILAKLHRACATVNAQLSAYEIGGAVATLYSWW